MPKKQTVCRITVDERLHDSLFRLLRADPAAGAETIALGDAGAWKDEDAVYVTPGTVLKLLRIGDAPGLLGKAVEQVTGAASGKPTAAQVWNGLAEGMVFLVGRFGTIPDKRGKEPVSIEPSGQGDKKLLRVDNLAAVKDGVRAAFAAAVSGRRPGVNRA
jgi:hypothetical protein